MVDAINLILPLDDILSNSLNFVQGFTYPVEEFFLEDVLEKTRYSIQSQSDGYQGNSRRRRKQQDSKKDPLTEVFEVCLTLLLSCKFYYMLFPKFHFFPLCLKL